MPLLIRWHHLAPTRDDCQWFLLLCSTQICCHILTDRKLNYHHWQMTCLSLFQRLPCLKVDNQSCSQKLQREAIQSSLICQKLSLLPQKPDVRIYEHLHYEMELWLQKSLCQKKFPQWGQLRLFPFDSAVRHKRSLGGHLTKHEFLSPSQSAISHLTLPFF